MLSGYGGWALDFPLGAAESRGGSRLYHTIDFDKGISCLVVWVIWRFFEIQDRSKANVSPFHDIAPFLARFCFEKFFELFTFGGPRLFIQLILEFRVSDLRLLKQ